MCYFTDQKDTKMTTTAKKELDMHDYANTTSSNMETNASTSGNKQNRETTTKIPGPNRRRKSNDDCPSSDHDGEDEVSNTAILEVVKSLTSMVEICNSRLNKNTLAIANLAESLDFNLKEIKDCKEKVTTFQFALKFMESKLAKDLYLMFKNDLNNEA